jgi:hypothetical protein
MYACRVGLTNKACAAPCCVGRGRQCRRAWPPLILPKAATQKSGAGFGPNKRNQTAASQIAIITAKKKTTPPDYHNSAGKYPLISRPMQISTRVGVVQTIRISFQFQFDCIHRSKTIAPIGKVTTLSQNYLLVPRKLSFDIAANRPRKWPVRQLLKMSVNTERQKLERCPGVKADEEKRPISDGPRYGPSCTAMREPHDVLRLPRPADRRSGPWANSFCRSNQCSSVLEPVGSNVKIYRPNWISRCRLKQNGPHYF